MEILYISSVPSKNQFNYMKDNLKAKVNEAKYGMRESGFKFHSLILEGLSNDSSNNIYSLIGRPTNFFTHKKLVWKKEKEIQKNITYHHISFVNLPVLKNLMVSLAYFYNTLKWLIRNRKNEKIIIMDAAYITAIPFVMLATFFIKCKKISIVCDIYEYMADVKDSRKKSLKIHHLFSNFMKYVYLKVDGFVFLTEAMNEVMNTQQAPYIVMEGLVDVKMEQMPKSYDNKKNIVMYAGALREQYGLKNLVNGFMKYEDEDAELWICGAGDYVPDIIEKQKKDSRIKYFGILPIEEVVKKELEATILVNPRPCDQEFTKYSFPSKNMEYMVSGTPILTTKLPGMPKEYYDYIFTIDGNKSSDITVALKKVFSHTRQEIENVGRCSRNFVLEKKNNIFQANRIIELGRLVNEKDN